MDSKAEHEAQSSLSDASKGPNDSGLEVVEARPIDSSSEGRSASPEGSPPPLPPRPNTLGLLDEGGASLRVPRGATQPNLQSKATTAVSITDIGSNGGAKENNPMHGLADNLRAKASLSHIASSRASEAGDSASIRSSIPHADSGEADHVFSDFIVSDDPVAQQDSSGLLRFPEFQADDVEDGFASEFESVGNVDEDGNNEGV